MFNIIVGGVVGFFAGYRWSIILTIVYLVLLGLSYVFLFPQLAPSWDPTTIVLQFIGMMVGATIKLFMKKEKAKKG
ncbi:MAG: hypothetical protein KatS3mg101_0546 [Patescibacteria group bacterium]|nr:MAG: hypothetical protein KatS3mg101_0546 [Patescibacteria group bacterium]